MEKIISFKKEILFKNNIEEILSISLDKTLEMEDKTIKGLFVISGDYSTYDGNKEKFNMEIPYVDYLEDRYDTNNAKIDIDDFYYEVVGKNKVDIHIDVKIDQLEEIKEIEAELEIYNDTIEDEFRLAPETEEIEELEEYIDVNNERHNENIEITTIKQSSVKQIQDVSNNVENSIFDIGANMSESYTTYRIYIIREGDTLENIVEKYNVSKEILVQYNSLNDIKIGDKIIIPNETN